MRSEKQLIQLIDSTMTTYKDARKQVHNLLVECLEHVSKGTFGPLYAILNAKDVGTDAEKMADWIRAVFPKDSCTLKRHNEKWSLKFSKDWTSKQGPTKAYAERNQAVEKIPYWKHGANKNRTAQPINEDVFRASLAKQISIARMVYGDDEVQDSIWSLSESQEVCKDAAKIAKKRRLELGIDKPAEVSARERENKGLEAENKAMEAELARLRAQIESLTAADAKPKQGTKAPNRSRNSGKQRAGANL